jgi:hypothetical protein
MSEPALTLEQQDRALSELLELGMSAAREVHASLVAAEEARAICELSLAFNRVSRSVRQTIALQAKVVRDRRRDDRDEAVDARRAGEARVSRRKSQVKAAVERLIWTEAEDDEAERLIDDLDDLICEDALYDSFTEEPVEAHIARICADLGIAAPPPEGAPAAGEGVSAAGLSEWRSSA